LTVIQSEGRTETARNRGNRIGDIGHAATIMPNRKWVARSLRNETPFAKRPYLVALIPH